MAADPAGRGKHSDCAGAQGEGGWFLNAEGKQKAYIGQDVGKLSPEQAREVYLHSLRVSKVQLVQGAERLAQESGLKWKSWQEDPLLRNCIPLPLWGGESVVAAAGGLKVKLDAELGLRYLIYSWGKGK